MPRSNSSDWAVNDQVTAARLQDINEDLDDLYAYGSDRGRIVEAVSGTALRIDIGAFGYRVGEVHGVYAGGTDIAVTDDATNYVMIDNTGTIQQSTSDWNAEYARMGIVTAASGAITSIVLHRPDVFGGDLGKNNDTIAASETLAATKTLTLSDEEQLVFNANGDSRIVNLPTSAIPTGRYFRIENATAYADGGCLMIHESGTQIWVISCQNYAYFMYNGTAWEVFAVDDNYERFGDGSDEEYTLDGVQAAVASLFSKSGSDYTLLRDAAFTDLHIESGSTLDTNGYKFTCIGVLDPQAAAENQIISNGGDAGNGGNASGVTAGTAGTAGAAAHSSSSLPDPAAGKAGSAGTNGANSASFESANSTAVTGNAVSVSIGGDGVAGGVGGAGGVTGASSEDPGTPGTSTGGVHTEPTPSEMLFNARIESPNWATDPTINGNAGSAPGSGGTGGAAAATSGTITSGAGGGGGGSGANGGNMYFAAVTIIGAGNIQAKGGNGGNGGNGSNAVDGGGGARGAGGGGAGSAGSGGMGGYIEAYYRSKANWSGSFDVSGGTKGTAGTPGTGAASGASGSSASSANDGTSGILHEYQI